MVAGIGGASLGTEIAKCLRLAGRYRVIGCDISPMAFGHYADEFDKTYLVDRKGYVEAVVAACLDAGADCLIPGAEEPLVLLARAAEEIQSAGIRLAANSASIIADMTDKKRTFELLGSLGIPTPLTLNVENDEDLAPMTYPCIVKPSTGSGGSSFVFLAENKNEALLYLHFLKNNGKTAIVQEYVSEADGEFTIGVLSLPNRQVVGSIALQRVFDSKLSVLTRGKTGLVSSGYSQGLIDDFPGHRAAAEHIAEAIGSVGPINVQGRVKNGQFVPFEINPRFSASTYLRAMAGFNEIDMFLRYLEDGTICPAPKPKPGYYLRSLSEVFVPREDVLS